MIQGSDFGGCWKMLLEHLLDGDVVSPRGIPTREETCVQVRVSYALNNILLCPARALSYRFMVAEWLWIWSGRGDLKALEPYAPQMAKYSDNGKTLAGAYGPRLASQWDWALAKLREDPATREAVLSIWTPAPAPSKDIPCTLSFQLLNRGGVLHGVVTMRSSDVWLGLPYDFFSFSMLLNTCAHALDLFVGSLTFNLGSSHLYEKDVAKVEECLREGKIGTLRSPKLNRVPPVVASLNEYYSNQPYDCYAKILADGTTNAEALEILKGISDGY